MKCGKYRHYKGKYYEVIGVAHHSETLEELVIYRTLYKHEKYGMHALWVRPRKMFFDTVVVDGVTIPRFMFCGDGSCGT